MKIGVHAYALSVCAAVTTLAACGGGTSSFASLGNGGAPSALARSASKTETFYYTGTQQTFIVPAHVKHVTVTAMGAGTPAAHGGLAAATIAVKPGERLAVFVGGERKGSTGGYNGGGYGGTYQCPTCTLIADGGAGASDVRQGGAKPNDRVLVAGGAGGKGGKGQYHGGLGGTGGGLSAMRGRHGVSSGSGHPKVFGGGGGGGTGGTQSRGGVGGAGGQGSYSGGAGGQGALGDGGIGGPSADASGYLGGGGGGGGGGYYGGGGGGSGGNVTGRNPASGDAAGVGSGGGGGGGSSFVESSATSVTMLKGGGSAGSGEVIISW
jgi:hypothetical protein